jgi:hypothetical protein
LLIALYIVCDRPSTPAVFLLPVPKVACGRIAVLM